MTVEMYPDRKTRDDVLDAWMRNLPPLAREMMKTIGMSEQEYRQRLEQYLFGPQLSISTGTETKPTTCSVPSVQVWQPWTEIPVTTNSIVIPSEQYFNITYN